MNGTQLATIEKIVGKVKVLKANELRATNAKPNQILYKDDLIITYKDAMTTIKLDDNSLVTLAEKTKLRVLNSKELKQEEGKIFYNIETQGKNTMTVATNFATIGVKGTSFIINDAQEQKDVSLKTGLVGVSALEGEFEIHKKKENKLSKYENYKLAEDNDFDNYKTKIEEEFIEYKKEFDLHPDYTISFSGNVVKENKTQEDVSTEFEEFENFQK